MEYNKELPRYIYIGDKCLELHLNYSNINTSKKRCWLWEANYKTDDNTPGRYFSETTLSGLQHRVWSWIVEQNILWDA